MAGKNHTRKRKKLKKESCIGVTLSFSGVCVDVFVAGQSYRQADDFISVLRALL